MIWRMKRLKKLKTLIFSMIKVGCMGFGGGNALIPVIEEEAVKDKKLVSCQEYDRTILAATLTPGALPVEDVYKRQEPDGGDGHKGHHKTE